MHRCSVASSPTYRACHRSSFMNTPDLTDAGVAELFNWKGKLMLRFSLRRNHNLAEAALDAVLNHS